MIAIAALLAIVLPNVGPIEVWSNCVTPQRLLRTPRTVREAAVSVGPPICASFSVFVDIS